jgi:hypothetical protein
MSWSHVVQNRNNSERVGDSFSFFYTLSTKLFLWRTDLDTMDYGQATVQWVVGASGGGQAATSTRSPSEACDGPLGPA